jgi:hypothetical protein
MGQADGSRCIVGRNLHEAGTCRRVTMSDKRCTGRGLSRRSRLRAPHDLDQLCERLRAERARQLRDRICRRHANITFWPAMAHRSAVPRPETRLSDVSRHCPNPFACTLSRLRAAFHSEQAGTARRRKCRLAQCWRRRLAHLVGGCRTPILNRSSSPTFPMTRSCAIRVSAAHGRPHVRIRGSMRM